MADSKHNAKALIGLRKSALLLLMGNKYLCSEVFLKKIGNYIKEDLIKLEKEIVTLKKNFPGKFINEVDTDGIIGKIRSNAAAMMETDKGNHNSDVLFTLGSTLEADLKAVEEAIGLIKLQLKGKSTSYSAVSNIVRQTKDIGELLRNMFIGALKIGGVLILVFIMALLFLYVTMPKEGIYQKKITKSEMRILLQQQISTFNDEIKAVSLKIKAMEDNADLRAQRIEILNHDMEIVELKDQIDNAESEIETLEKTVMENQQVIETLRSTPIVNRILRLKGN
jgi:hypothetical protein